MSTTTPRFSYAGVAAGMKKTGAATWRWSSATGRAAPRRPYAQPFAAAPVLYDRRCSPERSRPARGGDQRRLRQRLHRRSRPGGCRGDGRPGGGALGLPPRTIAVMSTGVIGPRLPMEKIAAGIRLAAGELSPAVGGGGAGHHDHGHPPKTAGGEVGGCASPACARARG